MAKKKTTTRKTTRQSAQAHSAYPHRSASTNSNSNSKAPSNASSPSPQPLDHGQGGRRKSAPRRSPCQNDSSKGIVFSFRIQNDHTLSMAVDIRKYDQQFGPPVNTAIAKSTVTSTGAVSTASPLALSHTGGNSDSSPSSSSSSRSSFSGPSSPLSSSSELRVAGERWSSDPTSFRSSNVYDQSRNLLILHTRKPSSPPVVGGEGPSPSGANNNNTSNSNHSHGFHPYRSEQQSSDSRSSSSSSLSSSVLSTPSLMHSGSSSSSVASSPTSSPSSPGDSGTGKDDGCNLESLPLPLPLPLPLDAIGAQSTRFLSVRGMGGAAKGRRMQVILV